MILQKEIKEGQCKKNVEYEYGDQIFKISNFFSIIQKPFLVWKLAKMLTIIMLYMLLIRHQLFPLTQNSLRSCNKNNF